MTPPQLSAADTLNLVILEMTKGRFLDVDNALDQFPKLNKDIRLFCQQCSDHIARSDPKPIPWPAVHSSCSPENSPVGKPAHEFSSFDDYLYFVLLSIINKHLCQNIFQPFHPAASMQESDRCKKEYAKLADTCRCLARLDLFRRLRFQIIALQMSSAKWRSEKFASIDNGVNADIFADLIRKLADTIIRELNKALEQLTEQVSFPGSFLPGLDSILKDAYNWNRGVKKDILRYDFEPYVIDPLSTWDPAQMEPFECIGIPIRPNSKIISSVSLGLVGRISLGNARESHVQRKARVLLEEWFANDPKGRTMNSPPGPPSAALISRPTGPRVTEQPRPTPPMIIIPQPGTPQPTPAGGPKGSLPGPSSAAPVSPATDPRPTGPRVTRQPSPTPPMTAIAHPSTQQPAPAGGPKKGSLPGPSSTAAVPPVPSDPRPRVTEQPRPTPPMTAIQPGRPQPTPTSRPRKGSLPGPFSATLFPQVPPNPRPTGPLVTEQPRPTPPMTTIPQPGRPRPAPAGGPGSGFSCC